MIYSEKATKIWPIFHLKLDTIGGLEKRRGREIYNIFVFPPKFEKLTVALYYGGFFQKIRNTLILKVFEKYKHQAPLALKIPLGCLNLRCTLFWLHFERKGTFFKLES